MNNEQVIEYINKEMEHLDEMCQLMIETYKMLCEMKEELLKSGRDEN